MHNHCQGYANGNIDGSHLLLSQDRTKLLVPQDYVCSGPSGLRLNVTKSSCGRIVSRNYDAFQVFQYWFLFFFVRFVFTENGEQMSMQRIIKWNAKMWKT